jgi:hypothetical protein
MDEVKGAAQAAHYLTLRPGLPHRIMQQLQLPWAAPAVCGWYRGSAAEASRPRVDVWEDPQALQYLRQELPRALVTAERWEHLQRVCRRYSFREEVLWYEAP